MSANFAGSPIPSFPQIVIQPSDPIEGQKQQANIPSIGSSSEHDTHAEPSRIPAYANFATKRPYELPGATQLLVVTTPNESHLDVVPPVDRQKFQVRTPLSEEHPRLLKDEAGPSSPPDVVVSEPDVLPPTRAPNTPPPSTSGERPAYLADNQNLEQARRYVATKPTCSFNLVCYRSGAAGCELHQIQAAMRSRFEDEATFQKALTKNPELIVTDIQFFKELRDVYQYKMCSFWRRAFFLKTLRGLRLLSVGASFLISFCM